MSDKKVLEEVGGAEVVEAGREKTVGVEAGGDRRWRPRGGHLANMAPGVVTSCRAGAGAGGPVGARVLECDQRGK